MLFNVAILPLIAALAGSVVAAPLNRDSALVVSVVWMLVPAGV
jgi:hypothetical protein